MNTRATMFAEKAERRIKLVEHLLATLDKPDPEIDNAWLEESERRLDAFLQGETSARDANDVLAKHLKP